MTQTSAADDPMPVTDASGAPGAADTGTALADCVLCGEPTEHPASTKGATLCPVCEWQEAQRTACSG